MHYKNSLQYILLFCTFITAACSATTEPKLITPDQVFSSPPHYNYPINNPYAATVIGVPPAMRVDYSSVPQLTDKTLILFKNRIVPEGFWYDNGLHYSELLQSMPAPLVYVIAGTGADNHSGTTITIADMLYSAGFSVVLLPSPTHPNFIINASESFVPGRPSHDARDLYRVMKIIDPDVASRATITNRMLIGYSLGAVDALFTAKLDDEQKSLNLSKVLLINPPLSLYNSMQTIDKLLYRSMPNGISDASQFIQSTAQRLSTVQQTNDALDFSNERLLFDAYNQDELGNNRLETIIGINFRLAAVNMIFTADVMGHDGYIFPKNLEFTTQTRLNDYMAVALRTSFKNYFDEIYTQKYQSANPNLTKQELIDEGDLQTMARFISEHKEIGMITNADDIILAPGEYKKLTRLFGANAITFSNGGHLGNLAHPAVAYRIVEFLKQ